MSKNDEGDSLAEKYLSVVPNGRKYLSLIQILDILHALKYHLFEIARIKLNLRQITLQILHLQLFHFCHK